ncbi:MAG: cytochrome P450 [Chloroflexota bacterium]
MGAASLPGDLLHTAAYAADPFPAWERLRHDAPIWFDPVADRWIVSRYDDVVAVLRDSATYGVARPYRRFSDQIGPTLVNLDGPPHRVRRTIVAPEVSGQRLAAHLPRIAERAADEVNAWPATGRVDALTTLCARLPSLVIAELLGLADGDHGFFAACSEAILAGLGGDPEVAARGRDAHRALAAHFDPAIDRAETTPGPDLISGIATAVVDGHRLTREEIGSMISLILVAGGETTGLAIANLWATLLADPEEVAALRADPARLDAVLSEAMRLNGAVIAEDRQVNVDAEWYGVTVPAGATIRALMGSANHDETRFRDPARFDPDRADLHRGKESRPAGQDPDGRWGHVTFGAGDHFCLGYQLGRAEMAAATTALLDRYADVRLAAPPDLRVEMALMRRVTRLELLLG